MEHRNNAVRSRRQRSEPVVCRQCASERSLGGLIIGFYAAQHKVAVRQHCNSQGISSHRYRTPNSASAVAHSAASLEHQLSSPGELEITFNTSEVAVRC
jgi:hypothetical protein